ncbi:MAG: hypothetical protein AAFQ08_01640, partial [Bacteroidota bacterium]
MKKISWLAATLLFLFAGCQGCQQHVIPQGLHELGIVLHCKKAATVASINGWPVIKIEGTREDDYMPPSATIGAILVPDSQAKDGKGKAIGTIETDIKAAGPNTTQKGAIQPNDIKTLPGGTLINYEGPKAKVFKEGQDALSFLISFLDPAREGLQPNTKYLTVVMAAALSSQKKVSQVFTSQDSCSYTTPDFSDNNPRKIKMGNATTKREIDPNTGDERVKFSFDAKATALPATGAKFFLLVQADTKELYTALEALIQNDNKTADGKPLKTLTDPNAGFTPVDPAQPTLILLPRGVTTAGNGTLQVTDVEDKAAVIPKGVKYSVHGLVYEPDGTYTVSTDRSKTIEVPAAEATLTMKKVEIANFIAETDAKGQGTVHAAELSLKGSVTNQKNTVKPRTYFVFHEAATATATKKDLIEAINEVGAQAAGLHQKNGFIIYAKAGSIAQDKDENVDQKLYEKAFAAGLLERGKTYQVYLAIKDDEGKGGTTLVGDTPMKLEVPDVKLSAQQTSYAHSVNSFTVSINRQITDTKYLCNPQEEGFVFVDKSTKTATAAAAAAAAAAFQYLLNSCRSIDVAIEQAKKNGKPVPSRKSWITNPGSTLLVAKKGLVTGNTNSQKCSDDYAYLNESTTYQVAYYWLRAGNALFYAQASGTFTTETLSPSHSIMKVTYNSKTYCIDDARPKKERIYL